MQFALYRAREQRIRKRILRSVCRRKGFVIDDYKVLKAYGAEVKEIKTLTSEKGQFEELEYFYRALKKENEYPIPLWQLEQATKLSIMGQG